MARKKIDVTTPANIAAPKFPSIQADPVPFPNPTHPVIPTSAMVRALITSPDWALRASDVAYRSNKVYQRMMREDPDIDTYLRVRLLAIKQLPWSIEAVDGENPEHNAQAKAIERAIQDFPKFKAMVRCLGLGCWFGRYGAQVDYMELPVPQVVEASTPIGNKSAKATLNVVPSGWTPVHGDSIRYNQVGETCVKVNTAWPNVDMKRVIMTDDAMAIKLNAEERSRFVIHKFEIEAADFNEPLEAEKPFGGTGLRSRLWYIWYLKQQLTQLATLYAERFARGIMTYKFPSGNPSAQALAQAILDQLISDFAVGIPVFDAEKEGTYGFEFIEASGTGYNVFREYIDSLKQDIRTAIVGQDLTTQTKATGMGSNTADQHRITFQQIVAGDAEDLSETLTTDLIAPLKQANFPDSDARLFFKFQADPGEADKFIENVKTFVNLGGQVATRDVRTRLQLREPNPGEETLGGTPDDDVSDLAQRISEGV